MGNEGDINWLNKVLTTVRAYVYLSSGAVGNTTFGLWGAFLVAGAICAFFIFSGYPQYAIAALLIIACWYLLYQHMTWSGIRNNPDAGAAGDKAYAQVVKLRQGALTIVEKDPPAPLLGTPLHPISERGDGDE